MAEQFGQTILGNVQELEVCGDAQAVAATPIELTGDNEPDLERLEGMLVTFAQPLTVTGNRSLGVFGELVLSADGRLFNPTDAIDPNEPDNSAVSAVALANHHRQILLDDGGDRRNPDPVPFLTESVPPRAGDTVTDLTGILGFGFGVYRILPVGPVLFERDNARTAAPSDVGGSQKVAAFNVLNYFTTLGERGADTAAELDRQRQKLIAALGAIDADVVGLIELENNGGVAIGDLVGRLNVALGGGTYAALPDPAFVGDDAIKVGMIFKPGRVTPVGQAVSADPAQNLLYGVFSRPPVGQVVEAGDQQFAVVVNHFKSKGCGGASGANADQGDGQGCWNALRVEQAEALLAFIEQIQTQSGVEDVLVLGDLNAQGEEDPIDTLRDRGLTDLLAAHVPEERRYSYVHEGEAGHLDHALATPTVAAKIAGATIWHINADEAETLDYRDENPDGLFQPDPYRSSDRDPVIIGPLTPIRHAVLGKGFVLATELDHAADENLEETPIRRRRVSEEIVLRLEAQIRSGAYQIGDNLPCQVRAEGSSGDLVGGGPLPGIAWLAHCLARQDRHLCAGDLILSGGLNAPLWLAPNGRHETAVVATIEDASAGFVIAWET